MIAATDNQYDWARRIVACYGRHEKTSAVDELSGAATCSRVKCSPIERTTGAGTNVLPVDKEFSMASTQHNEQALLQRVATWVPVTALLLSASLNVMLIQRVKAQAESTREVPLIGTHVPRLTGLTVRGAAGTYDYGTLPTIVYYFSASCGWCERNWSNVKALEAGTQGRYRIVGVSAERTPGSYLAERGLLFDVYSELPEATRRAFRFSGTPQTVVVSPSGYVVKSWMGAYNEQLAKELSIYFGVALPGVASSTPPHEVGTSLERSSSRPAPKAVANRAAPNR